MAAAVFAENVLVEDVLDDHARVLGIEVDLAAREGGLDDLGRADVLLVGDLEALRLERLLVELAEDELLGEVLRADHDRRSTRPVAGRASAGERPITIATPSEIANAALAARRVCFLITAPPSRSLAGATTLAARMPLGVIARLQREQHDPHSRRERHHAERRAEHAREPVARLVDDDVAEPAAAGDRGDRRRRDDRDRRDADAGEEQRQRERQLDAAAGSGVPDMPIPRAASTTSRSTPSTPT